MTTNKEINEVGIAAVIELMYQEFPWFKAWHQKLQRGLELKKTRSIKVQRTDEHFLNRAPGKNDIVCLFDRKGNQIGQVGYPDERAFSAFQAFMRKYFEIDTYLDRSETLEEAIVRLEEQNKEAYYVVGLSYGFFRDINCRASDVVICKPKGNVSLPVWLAEQHKKLLEQARAGILTVK